MYRPLSVVRLRGGSPRGLRWAVALLVICSAFGPARAADDPSTQPTTEPALAPTDPQRVDRWFADLGSSDASVRDTARAELMRLNRTDLPELQRLVHASRGLGPSQAVALKPIVQEIYLAGEPYKKDPLHGFLGILMNSPMYANADLQQPNDNGQTPGVIVADRFAGFCASRMLLDGDVILGTTDPAQSFNNAQELSNAISILSPGTEVKLVVLRRGQIIHVPIKLDCRPFEVMNVDPETFRHERAEKFERYWRETFAPLLGQSVG